MKRQAVTGVPCVFLDRDGTLNVEKGYLHKWDDWEWLPGVVDGLARLARAGFRLVVISNQSGMARGIYGLSEWERLCQNISLDLDRSNAKIDGFYFCPHHPDFGDECACRKPKPGLFFQAARDLGLDLSSSWMIGDKASDIMAGLSAGCQSVLVESGYGACEKARVPAGIPVCQDFSQAVDYILKASRAMAGIRSVPA